MIIGTLVFLLAAGVAFCFHMERVESERPGQPGKNTGDDAGLAGRQPAKVPDVASRSDWEGFAHPEKFVANCCCVACCHRRKTERGELEAAWAMTS